MGVLQVYLQNMRFYRHIFDTNMDIITARAGYISIQGIYLMLFSPYDNLIGGIIRFNDFY